MKISFDRTKLEAHKKNELHSVEAWCALLNSDPIEPTNVAAMVPSRELRKRTLQIAIIIQAKPAFGGWSSMALSFGLFGMRGSLSGVVLTMVSRGEQGWGQLQHHVKVLRLHSAPGSESGMEMGSVTRRRNG